jgi:hypothetical protein
MKIPSSRVSTFAVAGGLAAAIAAGVVAFQIGTPHVAQYTNGTGP